MLWRFVAAIGGAGGLASLLLPYARVSGGVLGVELQEGTYTLVELGRAVEQTGGDPTAIYALAVAIVVGATFALAGALVHHTLVAAGGLTLGGAAAAFWYGLSMEGSRTVLAGVGEIDATAEVGYLVLLGSAGITLFAVVLWMVTAGLRSRAATGRTSA